MDHKSKRGPASTTPWRTEPYSEHETIVGATNFVVANCSVPRKARTSVENQANAAFIVHAVNSHAALVEALDTIAKGMLNKFPGAPDVMQIPAAEFNSAMLEWSQKVARAALKLAGSE